MLLTAKVFHRGLLAVAAMLAASSVAMAADAMGGPVASTYSWTGGYIGAFAGYHDGNLTQSGCTGLCPTSSDGPSGGLVGVQAGYDYQLDNDIVLGGFIGVPLNHLHKTVQLGGFANFDVKPKFALLAGVRVGYAIDRFLPYALIGLEYARVGTTSSVTPATPSNDHVGPAFGVGLEYAFSQHLSADFRYSYASLPKKEYDFGGGSEKFGDSGNNFTVGINYRF
jgi:outer membrane immunogenic protein